MSQVQAPIGAKPQSATSSEPLASPEIVDFSGTGFALGSQGQSNQGGELLYIQASEAVALNMAVLVNESFGGALTTAANVAGGGEVCVAQDSALASGEQGWVRRLRGTGFSVNVQDACVANTALYTSATAGVLDDDATSQTKVEGLVITATNSSGDVAPINALASFGHGIVG